MIDTINAFKEISLEKQHIDRILDGLKNVKQIYSENTGYSYRGDLGNLKISFCESRMNINGSLNRYAKGDNVQFATLKDLEGAIEDISDSIGVDVSTFTLNRLDVGVNICTNTNIETIKAFLIKPNRTEMAAYKDGVYYENEVRSIVFYDKKKERKRKADIPASLVNKELIRAEYRLTKRDSIDRFFSSNNFKISTLLNDYYDVIEKVRNVFTSLQWISSKIIDPRSLLEDQNMKMQLMALGLGRLGGRFEVEQLLDIAKKESPNLYKNKIINLRKFLIKLEGLVLPSTMHLEIEQFQKQLEMSFKNVA